MTPTLSPELQQRIKQESIDYLKTTTSTSLKDAYIAGATNYATRVEDLERWKCEAMSLLNPIIEYGQSKESEIKLGQIITRIILQRAKQFLEAKKALEDAVAAHEADKLKLLDKYPQLEGKLDPAVLPWVHNAKSLLSSWKEEGKEGCRHE